MVCRLRGMMRLFDEWNNLFKLKYFWCNGGCGWTVEGSWKKIFSHNRLNMSKETVFKGTHAIYDKNLTSW